MVDKVSTPQGSMRAATSKAVGNASMAGRSAAAAPTISAPPAARMGQSANAGAADSLSLSAGAVGLPAELKSGPPVNKAQVGKIKEAIAEGRYPIDIQAIKEAMFQAWQESIA